MYKSFFILLLIFFACDNDQKTKDKPLIDKDAFLKARYHNVNGQPVYMERLSFLDDYQNLTLFQLNSNCGEFGGDIKEMKFYKDSLAGSIFVEYKKSYMNCETDSHPNEPKLVVLKKVLHEKQLNLLEQSILQLYNYKLNSNKNPGVHSGILNIIKSKDSTFLIRDYPSFEWSKFIELSNSIEN